jgi:hypothetical protein
MVPAEEVEAVVRVMVQVASRETAHTSMAVSLVVAEAAAAAEAVT